MRRYNALGWVVWKIGSRVARRRASRAKNKLLAALLILAVLVAGAVAARSGGEA